MRALLYVVIAAAVALAIAWFGFGVHPQTVYNKAVGMFGSAGESAARHAGDLKDTGSRFVDVIKNNYNDQDMTAPIAH